MAEGLLFMMATLDNFEIDRVAINLFLIKYLVRHGRGGAFIYGRSGLSRLAPYKR